MVLERLEGSFVFREPGRPWATSQKGQRRVHMSPMIINVAVPLLKHSPRFGQLASSQTVWRLFCRKMFLSRITLGVPGNCALIQDGLGSSSSRLLAGNLTGSRDIFSAPRCFRPFFVVMLLLGRSAQSGDNCRRGFCRHEHYLLGLQEASICLDRYEVKERTLVSGSRVDSILPQSVNAGHAERFLIDYFRGQHFHC